MSQQSSSMIVDSVQPPVGVSPACPPRGSVSRLGHLFILLLPVLPAVVSWRVHLHQIAAVSQVGPGEVDLAQALTWDRQRIVLWVDARSDAAFAQEHVPGAVLLNEDQWDDLFPEFLARWQQESHVVVYCDSSLCDASHQVADRLKKDLQTDRVHVLHGGWQTWLNAQHGRFETP